MTLAAAKPFAVAAWTLDESSGGRADSVGSNTLTDNNTVASATGLFGTAADFEKDNSEYLSKTDSADLSVGNIDFMLRLWVKVESFVTGSVIQKAGNNDLEYDLQTTGTGAFLFRVSSASGFANLTTVTTGPGYTTGTWILLHAWHDATNNLIGIATNANSGGAGAEFTTAYSAGSYDSGADFRLGGYANFGEYYDGLVDDVVVMKNRFLDATERTADYNSGTGVAFADWAPAGTTCTPTTAALTLATFAATVTVSAAQLATPTTASLALATFAPTVTASTTPVDIFTVGAFSRRRRRRTMQLVHR